MGSPRPAPLKLWVSRDFGLIFEEIYQGIFELKQANNTLVSVTSIDVNPQREFISASTDSILVRSALQRIRSVVVRIQAFARWHQAMKARFGTEEEFESSVTAYESAICVWLRVLPRLHHSWLPRYHFD